MSEEIPDFLISQPFESAHLGGPVFWCIDDGKAVDAVNWGLRADCRLIGCRIPAGKGNSLTKTGFRKIEELVTYSLELRDSPGHLPDKRIQVRDATFEDVDECRKIAKSSLKTDRFHQDVEIPNQDADLLKAAWVENSIKGRADRVLLATSNGTIVGFNALLVRQAIAVVDLIAVSPLFQRQGIGRLLMTHAIFEYAQRCNTMIVGSQAINTGSSSLYTSLGFKEVGRQETWHWTP